MSILFKSSAIFIDSDSDPFSGYILVSGEQVESLISEAEFDLSRHGNLKVFDFGDAVVMPGLIDLNVHLNSNYEEGWSDVENTTKMAVQGGTTTLIDNPILNNYSEGLDESEAIRQRVEKIKGRTFADIGLLALLSVHNYKEAEKIWDQKSVLGFKLYMSPTVQWNIPTIDCSQGRLKKIAEHMQKLSVSRGQIFVSVHAEAASKRDLFLCSPLRGEPKEKRLDLAEEIKDAEKFGGGIHGELENGDDSNKESSSAEEDEKEDTVHELGKGEGPTGFIDPRNLDSIPSGTLKIRSQDLAQIQDQRAIHKMEIMGYSFQEQDEDFAQLCEVSDPELIKSVGSSDDCEDEEEKNLIKRVSLQKKSIFSKKTGDQEHESPGCALNKLFKEKLRTAINLSSCADPETRMRKMPSKDQVLTELKRPPDIRPLFRNSEHLDNEDQGKIELTQSDDDKKENVKGSRRPSNLLLRRSSSRNLSSKSVDLSLSPTNKMKEELGKLKNSVQNSSYKFFLMNHFVAWELNGARMILNSFKGKDNLRVLISNLSNPGAAFLIRASRKKTPDLHIFCETSVPYIFFQEDMIKSGEAKFKGSPPIRDRENRNLLIAGLKLKDLFHCVSSYHMQVPGEYKTIDRGNFKRCFDGFSIIGFNLQVVWTKLYCPMKQKLKKGGAGSKELMKGQKVNEIMKSLIKLLSEKPAELIGLSHKKGRIRPGLDADFVVWDPFAISKVTPEQVHLKHAKTFLLRHYKLYGRVLATFLRGREVFSSQKAPSFYLHGSILPRTGP